MTRRSVRSCVWPCLLPRGTMGQGHRGGSKHCHFHCKRRAASSLAQRRCFFSGGGPRPPPLRRAQACRPPPPSRASMTAVVAASAWVRRKGEERPLVLVLLLLLPPPTPHLDAERGREADARVAATTLSAAARNEPLHRTLSTRGTLLRVAHASIMAAAGVDHVAGRRPAHLASRPPRGAQVRRSGGAAPFSHCPPPSTAHRPPAAAVLPAAVSRERRRRSPSAAPSPATVLSRPSPVDRPGAANGPHASAPPARAHPRLGDGGSRRAL